MACCAGLDGFEDKFLEMSSDLKSLSTVLQSHEEKTASYTLEAFKAIFEEMPKLSQLHTDREANAFVNRLTDKKGSLGGAEDGFSANPTLLKERVVLFVDTYLKSKETGQLIEFFQCFSKGDPCLSGRTESLHSFRAKLEGIDLSQIKDFSKILDPFAFVLSNFLEDFTKKDFIEAASDELKKKTLINLMKTGDFLQALQDSKRVPGMDDFYNFLKNEHGWDDDEITPSIAFVEKLTSSALFSVILNKSAEYVLEF